LRDNLRARLPLYTIILPQLYEGTHISIYFLPRQQKQNIQSESPRFWHIMSYIIIYNVEGSRRLHGEPADLVRLDNMYIGRAAAYTTGRYAASKRVVIEKRDGPPKMKRKKNLPINNIV